MVDISTVLRLSAPRSKEVLGGHRPAPRWETCKPATTRQEATSVHLDVEVAPSRGPLGGFRIIDKSCEVFIRHRPPRAHPRIRLALTSSGVDLASIQHRFDIEIGSNQEIDVESMSNRC